MPRSEADQSPENCSRCDNWARLSGLSRPIDEQEPRMCPKRPPDVPQTPRATRCSLELVVQASCAGEGVRPGSTPGRPSTRTGAAWPERRSRAASPITPVVPPRAAPMTFQAGGGAPRRASGLDNVTGPATSRPSGPSLHGPDRRGAATLGPRSLEPISRSGGNGWASSFPRSLDLRPVSRAVGRRARAAEKKHRVRRAKAQTS